MLCFMPLLHAWDVRHDWRRTCRDSSLMLRYVAHAQLCMHNETSSVRVRYMCKEIAHLSAFRPHSVFRALLILLLLLLLLLSLEGRREL